MWIVYWFGSSCRSFCFDWTFQDFIIVLKQHICKVVSLFDGYPNSFFLMIYSSYQRLTLCSLLGINTIKFRYHLMLIHFHRSMPMIAKNKFVFQKNLAILWVIIVLKKTNLILPISAMISHSLLIFHLWNKKYQNTTSDQRKPNPKSSNLRRLISHDE